MWSSNSFFLFLASIFIIQTVASSLPPNSCVEFKFEVSGTGTNEVINNPVNLQETSSIKTFVDAVFAGTINVTTTPFNTTGTFQMSARFCEPRIKNPLHKDTLQLLVHGSLYNKTIWSGLSQFETNSWEAFAASQGYPTLAIDRIGCGDSSHPNPISTVQIPLEAVLIDQIVQYIRSPSCNPKPLGLDKQYKNIVYVGFSFGSFVGNFMADIYPNDFDAFILTGYSGGLRFPIPFIQNNLTVARTVSPRFQDLDPAYLAASSEVGHTKAFYAGSFDPVVAHADFIGQDTLSVGETVTISLGFREVEYDGPVLVVAGEKDPNFCPVAGGACADILRETSNLFPKAKYESMVASDSGHTLMLHTSAPETFAGVHEWLAKLF